MHPKIETRKLGALFIEWKGVEVAYEETVSSAREFQEGVALRILSGAAAELRHRGVIANRKLVLRLTREVNLLAVRKRR